jgi:subtilase family serine protease
LTLPSGLATGTYYLLVRADADNMVVETIETNNVGQRSLRLGPDLIESTLTVPASTSAGSSFSVTDTVKNQGGGGAGASLTRLYLSTNTALDASDTLLGVRSVAALAANATHSASSALVMPATTVLGKHYILAVADADAAVPETYETNNVRAVAITVQ